jgi:hypothetical protein
MLCHGPSMNYSPCRTRLWKCALPCHILLSQTPRHEVLHQNFITLHRLRFAMKRPTERLDEFRTRINAAAETGGVSAVSGNDSNWLLGFRQRHKGSLHQDIWRGTAAELANCGYLAVFPGQGWWKTRRALERYDSEANYSLIVSIHAPETDVDLLTPFRSGSMH